MKLGIVAKIALCNDDGTVLALWRSNTDPDRPGGIDFPGGGVEDSEDFAAAVVRETDEEAGILLAHADVRLVYAATETSADGSPKHIRLLYAAKVSYPDVRLSYEHHAFEWLPVDEIIQHFNGKSYGPALTFAQEHGLLPI